MSPMSGGEMTFLISVVFVRDQLSSAGTNSIFEYNNTVVAGMPVGVGYILNASQLRPSGPRWAPTGSSRCWASFLKRCPTSTQSRPIRIWSSNPIRAPLPSELHQSIVFALRVLVLLWVRLLYQSGPQHRRPSQWCHRRRRRGFNCQRSHQSSRRISAVHQKLFRSDGCLQLWCSQSSTAIHRALHCDPWMCSTLTMVEQMESVLNSFWRSLKFSSYLYKIV